MRKTVCVTRVTSVTTWAALRADHSIVKARGRARSLNKAQFHDIDYLFYLSTRNSDSKGMRLMALNSAVSCR